MRKVIVAAGLQLYALGLAVAQTMPAVRTDEAKYLLDIPYPHPPLIRSLLASTTSWPWQEFFWRAVFATLVVQGVWMLLRLAKNLPREQTLILGVSWVAGGAVLLQAGTIMMAPLTALEALAFVAIALSHKRLSPNQTFWVGALWLVSLLTAYQAVLFAPLVIAILWQSQTPRWQQALYFLGPLIVAGLFALYEPTVLASFVSAGKVNASLAADVRTTNIFRAWLVSGSLVLGIAGITGMVRARQWPLLASLGLVLLFLAVSYREYYAILFAPLLVGGLYGLLKEKPLPALPYLLSLFAVSAALAGAYALPRPTLARQAMQLIASETKGEGDVLIAGDFGHEWQYESAAPVRRYRKGFLSAAKAVVCLKECPDMVGTPGWKRVVYPDAEMWLRK